MKNVLLILILLSVQCYGQLNISATATPFTIDFDGTVAGVNNGSFAGSGFAIVPVAGELDADAWETAGLSDGAKAFGIANTGGDHARGTSTGGAGTGGIYGFDVGGGDMAMGWQPGGSDATPGSITLLINNSTGATITSLDVSYVIEEFNDQARASSLDFSHDGAGTSGTGPLTTTEGSVTFTSTLAAGGGSWTSHNRSVTLSGLSIANGTNYYLRWHTDDAGGSGSRDEIAINDIVITANSAPPSNTITTTGVTGNPWTVDCTTPDAGTVTFTSTGTYNAANIYTAQLSDPTGGFGSPISIGTLASTANSGTINITIPAGTIAGTQYRIRVVSDDPVVTGSDNGVDLTINNSTATGTIIINEMSNGPSGAQEYFEMLVIGAVCSEVSIQNIIFDDNNGDWGGSGVANGHYRFTTDAQWGCVPTGTIIVVYNDGDPNPSVPADDETDANADNVFILPVSSNLIETCTTDPNPGSAPYNVGGCTYSSGGTWTSLGMSNSGDVAQTRDAAGNFVHGIGYGGAVAPAGGVDFGALGGGGDAFIFDNAVDDDFTDPNNFSFGVVGTFESPGSPNSANNDTYIQSFDCVVLPVEMLYFDLRQNESNVDLYWATASESNNDYFAVERSVDGINYEKIGSVAGMGTTSSANSYTYRDESPKTGLNYYRIRQVDFNGQSEYSGLRIANFKENNFSLLNQYQSSDNTLTVIVKGMQKELDVHLYSITGALMHSGISYSNSFDIPTSNLSSGIYIMQLESGGQIIRKKLYILK